MTTADPLTHARPVPALPAVLALARTELRLMARNRLVAFTAIGVPVLVGLALGTVPALLGVDRTPALQVVVVLSIAVYCGATTSLVARRQDGYLQRLRSGEIGDATVLAGLLVPAALLGAVQALLLAAATLLTGVAAPSPLGLPVLVLASALGAAFFTVAAAATAGLTRAPETAQITTLPLFAVVGSGAFLVALNGAATSVAQLAVPGAGIAELVRQAWVPGPNVLPALLWTVVWIGLAALAARRTFRWGPR